MDAIRFNIAVDASETGPILLHLHGKMNGMVEEAESYIAETKLEDYGTLAEEQLKSNIKDLLIVLQEKVGPPGLWIEV